MFDITHHINSDGAKASERNIGLDVAELGAQRRLHHVLHIAHGPAGNLNVAHIRQGDHALAVDHSAKSLCDAAKQVDIQAVSGSQHIVRPNRQIHRQGIQVAGTVLKDVHAESIQEPETGGHIERTGRTEQGTSA